MSYVIKAVLSNAQGPECGQAAIPFPISDEEYDHTVEILESLGIGDALRQDCQVDELDSHYSVLKRLEGRSINLDELDYLAGVPGANQRSVCAGERRRSGMSEPRRMRRGEGYGACADDGQLL